MNRHVTERVSVARDFRNPGQKEIQPKQKATQCYCKCHRDLQNQLHIGLH